MGIEQEKRSPEVQEIMDSLPNWIVLKGNILILITIMGVMACSWFIKSPNYTTADLRIEATQDNQNSLTVKFEIPIIDRERFFTGQFLEIGLKTDGSENPYNFSARVTNININNDNNELYSITLEMLKNNIDQVDLKSILIKRPFTKVEIIIDKPSLFERMFSGLYLIF